MRIRKRRRREGATPELPEPEGPASPKGDRALSPYACFVGGLAAVGIVLIQLAFGGLMRPAFSVPGHALIAVAGLLALPLVVRLPRLHPAAVVSAIAFFGWGLFRVATSAENSFASIQESQLLAGGVLYGVVAIALRTPGARMAFLVPLLLMAVAQSGLAAYQSFIDSQAWPLHQLSVQMERWYRDRFLLRAHGFYGSPNHLPWFLMFPAIFALAFVLWGRWKPVVKIVLLYVAAVSVAAVVLTMSRGGVLGVAVALATFFLLSLVAWWPVSKQRGIMVPVIGVFLLLLVLGGAFFTLVENLPVRQRLSLLTEDSYRPSLWPVAIRLFEQAPLFGNGAGTFTHLSRQSLPRGAGDAVYAHNDWLQIAAEFGGVGLLLLLGLVLAHAAAGCLNVGRLLRDRLARGEGRSNELAVQMAALSLLAGYAVNGFFDFNLQLPANSLLAVALPGLLAGVSVPRNSDRKSSWPSRAAGVAAALASFVLAGWLGLVLLGSWRADFAELRAENAFLRGEPARALEIAEAGLAVRPQSGPLNFFRGEAITELAWDETRSLDRFTRWREAAAAYAAAVEAVPDERYYRLVLARRLDWLSRYPEARDQLVEGVRLDPGRGFPYEYLGLHYKSLGRADLAKRWFGIARNLPGFSIAIQQMRELNQQQKARPQTPPRDGK